MSAKLLDSPAAFDLHPQSDLKAVCKRLSNMSVKEYLCTVCNGFIYKTPGTPLKTAERQITCNESLQFSDCSFCNLIITLLEELAPEWRNTNPPYTFEYQLDKTNSDLRRVLIFQFVDGWNTSDGRPYAADVMLYGNPSKYGIRF